MDTISLVTARIIRMLSRLAIPILSNPATRMLNKARIPMISEAVIHMAPKPEILTRNNLPILILSNSIPRLEDMVVRPMRTLALFFAYRHRAE